MSLDISVEQPPCPHCGHEGEDLCDVNITYNVAWLRQEENQYLSTPPEIAESLDDDLLRLMGWSMGAYALGYIDDGRHPLEAVRGRSGTMSLGELPSNP